MGQDNAPAAAGGSSLRGWEVVKAILLISILGLVCATTGLSARTYSTVKGFKTTPVVRNTPSGRDRHQPSYLAFLMGWLGPWATSLTSAFDLYGSQVINAAPAVTPAAPIPSPSPVPPPATSSPTKYYLAANSSTVVRIQIRLNPSRRSEATIASAGVLLTLRSWYHLP